MKFIVSLFNCERVPLYVEYLKVFYLVFSAEDLDNRLKVLEFIVSNGENVQVDQRF